MTASRILAIQRRHAPMFRIRLGKQEDGVPTRLVNEIRVTSPNKAVVEAFAEVHGGRPMRWVRSKTKTEYQAFLPITRLPIMLLPGEPLQQTMELWAGQTCQRRCDSETMVGGAPCECGPDKPIEERECKPTSRLTVACPDVPIVGVGLLVTGSVIAAGELAGTLALAEPLLRQNQSVRATLRIDQMVTPGHKFAVPRIELEDITFEDIALAASSLPALGPAPRLEPLALQGGE